MQQTVMTRDMATKFINIYHKTVHIHQYEDDYLLKNYTDEFYEGCILNTSLFTQIRSMTEVDPYSFVQTVYDAIHVLMSPGYCLVNNINYCIDYVNIDAQAGHHLNAANLNYHVLHKIHTGHYYNISVCYEDLNDATLEPNTCSVCQYENNTKPTERQHLKKFYYSSAFLLNTPVCQDCLISDDTEKEAKAEMKDPDYQPFVFKCENESDEDSNTIDSEDAYSNEAVAYDLDVELDSYNDNDTINENIVLTNTYSAVLYEYDAELHKAQPEIDNDSERCYAFAWQCGWDSAMKYMEEYAQTPLPASVSSSSEYCDKDGKTRKCGGTYNGQVRYCSVECQTADWKQVHKYACLKHTF